MCTVSGQAAVDELHSIDSKQDRVLDSVLILCYDSPKESTSMRISSEEAKRRLTSSSNLANRLMSPSVSSVGASDSASGQSEGVLSANVEHKKKGLLVRTGSHVIPEFIRDQMIELKAAGATGSQMGRAFGVSQEAASAAARGASGGRPPTAERKLKVEAAQSQIRDTALLKLMKSLDLITDDKLEDLGAKELSNVASNLSRVVTSVSEAESNKSPVNIVVYAPEMKKETQYKIIDVG